MDPVYFRSPWSKTLKISTAVFLALFLLAMILGGPAGALLGGALLVAAFLLMVNGYSIQNGHVFVYGLLWRKAFDLCELQDILAEPYLTNGSVRTFGLGGLFSSIGYFRNQELGNYLGFMTDAKNTVALDFVSKRLVVTPEDPQGFRDAVLAEYRKIHV
jgi:hypothetical protein